MSHADKILRLARIARGIETGGHYNAAKVVRALAFSEEVRASNEAGIPRGNALLNELGALINDLKAEGADGAVVAALGNGLEAIRTEQPGRYTDIPAVYVSRTCGDIFLGERPDESPCNDDARDLREFLPYYYLEPMPVPALIEALRTFPATIAACMDRLNEPQMGTAPAPGEWSLRELLTHLNVTQGLLHSRLEQFLSQDNPTLRGVAAWTMATGEDSGVRKLFDGYATSRAATVARLESVRAADWWRTAYHDEFGTITLHQHVSYFARHERSHHAQMVDIVRVASANDRTH